MTDLVNPIDMFDRPLQVGDFVIYAVTQYQSSALRPGRIYHIEESSRHGRGIFNFKVVSVRKCHHWNNGIHTCTWEVKAGNIDSRDRLMKMNWSEIPPDVFDELNKSYEARIGRVR